MAMIRVLRGYPGSETCQLGFRTTKWEDCSDGFPCEINTDNIPETRTDYCGTSPSSIPLWIKTYKVAPLQKLSRFGVP